MPVILRVGNKYSKTDENKTGKHSYAEATTSDEVVIIKPKMKQESKKTVEALQKNIKPAVLEVGITAVKNIKEGGVVIKCKNKEEQEKIKKAAEKKLTKNYEIKAPELKNPCIKIIDIQDKLEADELINCILKQNVYLQDMKNIFLKLRIIKKMRRNYMAIVECDPLAYKKIISEGHLCINWSRCRVFEYIGVFRCFKCAGFDHHAENCNSEPRCLHCASKDHQTEACENDTVKCVNCIDSNMKFNIGLDVNHKVYDKSCPVYLKKVQIQRQKIKCINEE